MSEKARHACTDYQPCSFGGLWRNSEFRDNYPDEHHPTPPLPSIHMEKTHPSYGDRATRLDEEPYFTCEHDQEMKRLVTPRRWGTSPSVGPLPPCEQALNLPCFSSLDVTSTAGASVAPYSAENIIIPGDNVLHWYLLWVKKFQATPTKPDLLCTS